MRIAVAGGTGHVGTHVVAAARKRGHDVVVLTRGNGVDLVAGTGVAKALEGVDAVIDVASVTTLDAGESVAFFEATTRTLLAAEAQAGVGHHLALSIVGIDRAPEGYYAGKVAQERLVESGDVAWTILRATQFHEFAEQIYERAKIGPFHVAPRMRTQPIAAREVGAHLVSLAEAEPAGRARDLAGPREESLVEMVRGLARARGSRAWIPAIPLPGVIGPGAARRLVAARTRCRSGNADLRGVARDAPRRHARPLPGPRLGIRCLVELIGGYAHVGLVAEVPDQREEDAADQPAGQDRPLHRGRRLREVAQRPERGSRPHRVRRTARSDPTARGGTATGRSRPRSGWRSGS